MSNAYKTVKWVENTLIKHADFLQPGLKVVFEKEQGKLDKGVLWITNSGYKQVLKEYKVQTTEYN